MGFGQNLQYLRKMRHSMTQDALAEKMGVSRQTVSKWEMDDAYPEMDKALELCRIFSCSMDQLFREDITVSGDAYSNIRIEKTKSFRYVRYAVVSEDPEGDAVGHIRNWAAGHGVPDPEIIGWDFPHVSQEQINVFHMHGYAGACVLPEGFDEKGCGMEVLRQPEQSCAAITITEPFRAPFTLIPNAYKALMSFMQVNGCRHKCDKDGSLVACYEKVYRRGEAEFMDVYTAVEG